MTLCEVKGFGHHTAHNEIYRDSTYRVDFLPQASRWKSCCRTNSSIWRSARSCVRRARGKDGDGKLFITPVEQVIRIRTAETGVNAI